MVDFESLHNKSRLFQRQKQWHKAIENQLSVLIATICQKQLLQIVFGKFGISSDRLYLIQKISTLFLLFLIIHQQMNNYHQYFPKSHLFIRLYATKRNFVALIIQEQCFVKHRQAIIKFARFYDIFGIFHNLFTYFVNFISLSYCIQH